MGSVSVIGMGPAGGEFVLPAGTARIRQADILIGGERHVRPYKNSGKEIIQLKGNWKTAADRIASAGSDKNIAVLVSGDPALYSYTAVLQRQLAGTDIDIVPGYLELSVFIGGPRHQLERGRRAVLPRRTAPLESPPPFGQRGAGRRQRRATFSIMQDSENRYYLYR